MSTPIGTQWLSGPAIKTCSKSEAGQKDMNMKTFFALLLLVFFSNSYSQPSENKTSVLSSPGGRYVFGQISQARRDQYMLDTQTGRLWQIVQSTYKREDGSEGTFESLQSIPYDQKGIYTTPPALQSK